MPFVSLERPRQDYSDYLQFVQEKDRMGTEVLIRSHVKGGDDQGKIFNCIMELSKAGIVGNANGY